MKNKKRIKKLINKKYKKSNLYPYNHSCSPEIIKLLFDSWSASEKFFRSSFGFNKVPDLLRSGATIWAKNIGMIDKPEFEMISTNDRKLEFTDYENEPSVFPHGIVNYIMEEGINQVSKKHLDALQKYLQENLENLGFFFETDKQFFKFIEDRIIRTEFTENPYYYEYYLDYVSEDNKGTFIGCSSSKISTEFDQGKITFTIG